MSGSGQLHRRAGEGGLGSLRARPPGSMNSMDMAVAKLNIAHYKLLLVTETDMAKRETIAGLLAKEEAGLAKLLKERKSD